MKDCRLTPSLFDNNHKLKEVGSWLTEDKLGVLLKSIFPMSEFIRDSIVPDSGRKFRPDYRSDDLMLIVEFDGHHHYTNPLQIANDKIKDRLYSSMGYRVVRIPYFIQLDQSTVNWFFNVEWAPEDSEIVDCPHGFHSKNVVTPAYFCTAGYAKYENMMLELTRLERKGIDCPLGEHGVFKINYTGYARVVERGLSYELFDGNKDRYAEYLMGWPS